MHRLQRLGSIRGNTYICNSYKKDLSALRMHLALRSTSLEDLLDDGCMQCGNFPFSASQNYARVDACKLHVAGPSRHSTASCCYSHKQDVCRQHCISVKYGLFIRNTGVHNIRR